MKLKQNIAFFAGFIALSVLFSLTGCTTAMPYEESRSGDYLYLNPFDPKPADAQDHWDYALSLQEEGKTAAACRQFEILVKRWPESPEAAAAQRAAADLYYDLGKNKKSFDAYETLVSRYYTSIKNYSGVLERQYDIAIQEMNRKRMKWLFGGYQAPERAVPFFESIIQSAPQWERAAEMQYMIGEAYRKNDNLEQAIVSYATVEYRYPDSAFAEKAAFAKIESLRDLVRNTPYSVDIREQAELSVSLFPELYPASEHLDDVKAFGVELRELAAEHEYEIGEFYENQPETPNTDAAAIYYKKTDSAYAGTPPAEKAEGRLHVLFPVEGAGSVTNVAPVIEPVHETDEPTSKESALVVEPVSEISPEQISGEPSVNAVIEPALKSTAVTVAPLPERTVDDEEAIEITADRMEYADKLMIADGNVALQQKGATLQADHVSVDPDTGEIVASGNILMLREGESWQGQNLIYNYKTRKGTFGESTMYFEPAYISAEKTDRISTNEFVLYNVLMTTCSGDSPAIYAKAKEAHLVDNGRRGDPYIRAKHVTFYIGPVPVFYMPVWKRHLGDRVFTYYFGYGSRLGAFAKVRAELHPTEWLTTSTHFDVYANRGIGLGQDFDWNASLGEGKIKLYHINDSEPYDDDDSAAQQALTDESRSRIRFENQKRFDAETYFMTRINWVSDPGIIEDFFTEEFRNEANPENFAVIQRATDDYGASVRVDHRLNDFYTAVDRSPSVSYDRYLTQYKDSRFYFESENNIAGLDLLNAQLPGVSNVVRNGVTNALPEDYSTIRLDTYNRLFLPLKYEDYLNVIPRVGYRGTWYSDTVSGSGSLRNILEFGTLTSFKSYKMLTEKSGFYGNGMRHIVEPYADYSYRFEPNLTPEDLYQFDDIDTFDKQNEVRIGARNFLQTKRGEKLIANFLDSDVYTTIRLETADGQSTLGPLVADAEMSITEQLWLQGDFEFDWGDTGTLSPFNLGLHYVADDQSTYSLGYRFRDDETAKRSLLFGSVRLFPSEKWSYELAARYDSDSGIWEDRKVIVNHRFDCVTLGVGMRIDEDSETLFWFQFWLNAYPNAGLDLGR